MVVNENYTLKSLNTFGIEVSARYFSVFRSLKELEELLERAQDHQCLVLGGGSNILLTENVDGYVMKNDIRGIEVSSEDADHVYLKVGAGEHWHGFVLDALSRDLGGVENLSLIPGSTGASPMQNIGAYGVEIKDVFEELEAYHIRDRRVARFSASDCEFGYRESVFKKRHRGEFVILNVTFRLDKRPRLNTSYGAIAEELQKMNVPVSIHAVSQAVINIRKSKLPNPAEIGNAGSFFKNPAVSAESYDALRNEYPSIPGYVQRDGTVKLAAGWLIEQCGWKGFRRGDAGCHARQALVLVNFGNASGSEIYELSAEIRRSVKDSFGVDLEREVNVVGKVSPGV